MKKKASQPVVATAPPPVQFINLWEKALSLLEKWDKERSGNNHKEVLLAALTYAILAQRETWVPRGKSS